MVLYYGVVNVNKNILLEKSILFAARIIKLQEYLVKTKKEFTISKQIVRSGTSIGANISEANYGQSRADFVAKLYIALKEAAETEYWIMLLAKTDFISASESESLLSDCIELKKLLTASIKSAKNNQNVISKM